MGFCYPFVVVWGHNLSQEENDVRESDVSRFEQRPVLPEEFLRWLFNQDGKLSPQRSPWQRLEFGQLMKLVGVVPFHASNYVFAHDIFPFTFHRLYIRQREGRSSSRPVGHFRGQRHRLACRIRCWSRALRSLRFLKGLCLWIWWILELILSGIFDRYAAFFLVKIINCYSCKTKTLIFL